MNQKIITAIVVLGLLTGLFFFSKITPPSIPSTSTENSELSLPQNWKLITSSGKSYKIEKTGTYQIKPLIVTSVSSLPDTEKTDTYVDKLISGAKATLPGLNYSINQKEPFQAYYLRRLIGSYYSGKNKINLFQRIYIDKNDITTITASCPTDSCLESEVSPIFDTLWLRLSE